MKNRRGKFKLSADIVRDGPEAVLQIMAHIIVTRCEYIWESDVFEYNAISNLFREVPIGEVTPTYKFIVTKLQRHVYCDPQYTVDCEETTPQ